MNRRAALSLAVFTLFVFPLIGMFIINLFSDQDIQIMIRQRSPLWQQLAIGGAVGAVMGFIAHFVSGSDFMQRSKKVQELKVLFRNLHLSVFDCALISIAVGFGEELLFRGAIQPFWGVIPTAIFFVAIHGYLNLRDWRISVYGLVMSVFIVIIGLMTEYFGIWSAAAAHALIDFVLLVNMDVGEEEEMRYPVLGEEE